MEGKETETVLTDNDRQIIDGWMGQANNNGAMEAIQHIENYCNDHIIKFAIPTRPEIHGAVKMCQAIKELIGGMREYYEKPEQFDRIIKRAQRKRSKGRKEALKLAA
ncbi:MAG: hypothetical protein HIU83_14980 [Proteobacteria bacterium]|nr:hypothetical protein [Pseudomonadota bacterium]